MTRLITCSKDSIKPALLSAVFLLSALCCFTIAAADDPEKQDPAASLHPNFGIRGWYSSADANWRISFPATLSGMTGKGESELHFSHLNSPIVIVNAGSRIDSLFSFDIAYGVGSISGGRGIDTDRFFPSSGGGLEYSRSQSDISGEVRMWEINFHADNGQSTRGKNSIWGAVIGFLHYEDNLIMRNGVQLIPFYTPFSQSLDSTYNFSWDTLKLGVTHQAPITPSISYSGALSVYPVVWYEGEGYWNLRTTGSGAFRTQSPNFVQKSTTGYGYEASLGIKYAPANNIELSAGYRYLYLYARNGTDTLYYADGTSANSRLDWVTVTRQGAFADVQLRF